MVFLALEVIEPEVGHLAPAPSAAQHSAPGSLVAAALQAAPVRGRATPRLLLRRQPVAQPHRPPWPPLHGGYARRPCSGLSSPCRRLHRRAADRSQAQVDRSRRQPPALHFQPVFFKRQDTVLLNASRGSEQYQRRNRQFPTGSPLRRGDERVQTGALGEYEVRQPQDPLGVLFVFARCIIPAPPAGEPWWPKRVATGTGRV